MFNVFNKFSYQMSRGPIKKVRLFFCDLKCCRQRIKRGFSDYDVTEFAGWFENVVPDMLRQYAQRSFGYPESYEKKFYEKHKDEIGEPYRLFICTRKNDPVHEKWSVLCDKVCEINWKKTVRKIAFLFDEANEDRCSRQNPYEYGDPRHEKADEKIYEYRKKCRKKAFEMLNEFFYDIWY